MSKYNFDQEPDAKAPARIAAEVMEERLNQILQHGYTPAHDDDHPNGELAMVAALYASPMDNLLMVETDNEEVITKDPWPFWMASPGTPHSDRHGDKRATLNKRERLVIAGALILAEIERYDRSTGKADNVQPNIPELERDNIKRVLEQLGDTPFGPSALQRGLGIGYKNASNCINRGLIEGVLVPFGSSQVQVQRAPTKKEDYRTSSNDH